MNQPMTPQERAAELCFKLALLVDADTHMEVDQDAMKAITAAITETRRAALLEVAEEIERFIDYSGGCVGTENDPRVVAVNRFSTINIVPLLNRLAQEG